MDQQLACPHCHQVVALPPAATTRQAQCPHCQGLFLAPAADTAEPQSQAPNAARGVAGLSSPGKSPLSPAHVKYLAAAAVMIGMTVVPVVGFAVVRWLSPPAEPAHATAKAQPAPPAEVGKVISGTVEMKQPVAPSQNAVAQANNQPKATATPNKVPGPAQIVAQVSNTSPPPSAGRPATPAQTGAPKRSPSPVSTATASAEVAQANTGAGDTTALVQRIEPSVVVVQVTLEKGSSIGSGFPLDDKGTIVTNYHVIEGAKAAQIKFGQKTVDIEGFLVFAPGKDIAILKAKLGPEKVAPLTLASGTPSKGETVLTFGAPLGFDSTVSNGIVSSVRKGTELQEIFKKMSGEDIYVNHQHYDLDATWVQTTAPISGGNSGGPLVNLKGEVVGLNTWALTRGQNMNFAISVNHIKQMMASANSGVHPLSELPPPREHEVAGNTNRTLEYWEQVSKINRNLANRLKTIRQPSIPGKKVTRAQVAVLYPKLAGIYKKLADMLPEAAAKLKALKIDDVDGDLVALVTVDALLMEKIGQDARDLSADAKKFSLDKVILYDSEKLGKKAYGEYDKLEIGQAYDVMRIRLTNRYGETFASIFDASARSKSGSASADEDDTPEGDGKAADAGDAKREKDAAGKLKFAKSLKDAGKRDAAKERLQKIVEDFAGTKAAAEAQKLLDELAAP